MAMIRRGDTHRSVSMTQMNRQSSRSHAIFKIKVGSCPKRSNDGQHLDTSAQLSTLKSSALHLIDLAGSERVSKTAAKGVQLTEAANINKSLLTLGKVIKKLSKAKNKRMLKHVPFRESKLTRLLQSSLGGNAKTCILCACSPAEYNREETRSTLQFASRAASIENKAKVNEISVGDPTQMMKKQKEEIDRLKRMLQGVNVAMVQQSARLDQMKTMATDGIRGGLNKDEAMQRILLAVEDAESAAQPLNELIRFSPADSASIGRVSRIESDLDLTDYDALGVIGTPLIGSQPAGALNTIGEVSLGKSGGMMGAASTAAAAASTSEFRTGLGGSFAESARSASPGSQLEARTQRSMLSHIRRAESPSAIGPGDEEGGETGDSPERQEELQRRHKVALVLRRMILRKVSRAFQTWTNFVRVIFLHTYMQKGSMNVSVICVVIDDKTNSATL